MSSAARQVRLSIIGNNIAHDTNLTTAWGMSCVIEGTEKSILFDTGSDGTILLHNMGLLGIQPRGIDIVCISHLHWDHTGGLHTLLEKNKSVEVVLPGSAPAEFTSSIAHEHIRCTRVTEPMPLCAHVYSTGEIGGAGIKEQALIIETETGLIVITGCAHPGVVAIAAKATDLRKRKINLLFGGFHLAGMSDQELERIMVELRDLGVQNVGPSHCTGERAMELFHAEWQDKYLDLSLGARLVLNARQ